MHSEFKNVALDRIRYSLVWEDSKTMYDALDIQPSDKVLVITSAGCNVLNALLKKPEELTAIDLNPVQNNLLKMKKHIILHHSHDVFRGLMGFDGPQAVAASWKVVEPSLVEEKKSFWSSFFQEHPAGIIGAGRLEMYLLNFVQTLPVEVQGKLRKLIDFDHLTDQRKFFMEELHNSTFRHQFIEFFDRNNLSKGRDPKLFKYAWESGGESFYLRLLQQISTVCVRNNFFFRFFFFGPQGLPENILPPCYQKENFPLLRQQISRLKIINGEVVDYLVSEAGAAITKASLSNVFEYTSEEEFKEACKAIFGNGKKRNLRVVFWNLLMDQGAFGEPLIPLLEKESEILSRHEACFYFRNVRLLKSVAVPSPLVHKVLSTG